MQQILLVDWMVEKGLLLIEYNRLEINEGRSERGEPAVVKHYITTAECKIPAGGIWESKGKDGEKSEFVNAQIHGITTSEELPIQQLKAKLGGMLISQFASCYIKLFIDNKLEPLL